MIFAEQVGLLLLPLVSLELSLVVSDVSLTAFRRTSPNSKLVTGFDGLRRYNLHWAGVSSALSVDNLLLVSICQR